jgi:predicted acylesterase/phospholipase RssA
MTRSARSALVLQGGGALGAYELGAARALYEDGDFAPDIIAGVSIGAITAVLLARPRRSLSPLQALEEFWKEVTVPGSAWPPPLRPYASFLGNPHFFTPRFDYFNWLSWTYFYETEPLHQTLKQLVDLKALADRNEAPKLLVSATNLKDGQIDYFYSESISLTLEHIVASGSLPPAFPMTVIGQDCYWDGGLFDNTPLGPVIDKLDDAPNVDRTIYVVNLFPNKARVPRNLPEIMARIKNLQFANKTLDDVKMMRRFNEVAKLMEAIEKLPEGHPLKTDPAYAVVKERGYLRVPKIVSVTLPGPFDEFSDADFSPEAIQKRAEKGYAQTMAALKAAARQSSGH